MNEMVHFLNTAMQATRDIHGTPIYGRFNDDKWSYTARLISWNAEPENPDTDVDIDVPIGFVTDLASVPRPFWSMLPRDGPYVSAAIIHDYAYWMQPCTRRQADAIFDLGMKQLGVDKVARLAVSNAVATFGDAAWAANAKLRQAGEKRVLKRLPDRADITWEQWKREPDIFLD